MKLVVERNLRSKLESPQWLRFVLSPGTWELSTSPWGVNELLSVDFPYVKAVRNWSPRPKRLFRLAISASYLDEPLIWVTATPRSCAIPATGTRAAVSATEFVVTPRMGFATDAIPGWFAARVLSSLNPCDPMYPISNRKSWANSCWMLMF